MKEVIEVTGYTDTTVSDLRMSIRPFLSSSEKEAKKYLKKTLKLKSPIELIDITFISTKPDIDLAVETIRESKNPQEEIKFFSDEFINLIKKEL